ncbi:MAG TPA: hypothetical protein VK110_03160, partial [Salinisphaeraceae bacterium]|nr:hypothetical protein [Salinisphaeraceae bacterium]
HLHRLPLDCQQGALLQDQPQTRLTLADPALQFLDVASCPHLARLDLSAACPGMHVTIRDCPRLRELMLPTARQGAILHVDFGQTLPRLDVSGHLQALDACWAGGRFAIADDRERDAFAGAHISTAAAVVATTQAELLVLIGAQDMAEQFTLPAASRVRAFIGHGCTRVRSFDSEAAQLQHVQLQGWSGLECFTARAGLRLLELCAAPHLAQIAAHGRRLLLSNDDNPRALQVSGNWQAMHLSRVGVRVLTAPGLTSLSLHQCLQLSGLHVDKCTSIGVSGSTRLVGLHPKRLRLDDSAMLDLARRAGAGDVAARDLLHDWCASVQKRKSRLAALVALAELAELGHDPHVLWALRCRLHASCRSRKAQPPASVLQQALDGWDWEFPADLAQTGWDADLRLWWACRHAPQARRFRRVLRRTAEPRHLATMARWLRFNAQWCSKNNALYRCLLLALQQPAPQMDSWMRHFFAVREVEHLDSVIQALVVLRCPALADALLAYARNRLTLRCAIDLCGRLLALGYTPARQQLMQLSAAHAGRDPLAAQAMGQALAPVQRDLLRLPDDQEQGERHVACH